MPKLPIWMKQKNDTIKTASPVTPQQSNIQPHACRITRNAVTGTIMTHGFISTFTLQWLWRSAKEDICHMDLYGDGQSAGQIRGWDQLTVIITAYAVLKQYTNSAGRRAEATPMDCFYEASHPIIICFCVPR